MAGVANMEFAQHWDNEASVSQNDDIEAEKEDGPPTHFIPGYATFDGYLQVCLLAYSLTHISRVENPFQVRIILFT